MEKKSTTRDRFLETQKNIKKANAVANQKHDDEEIDELMDELDDEDKKKVPIDKHIGTKKIVVTKEQNEKAKEVRIQNEALQSMSQLHAKVKPHLNQVQANKLQGILKKVADCESVDPVLGHFIKKKIENASEFANMNVKMREMQKKLLQDLTLVSNDIIKCRGASEFLDKEILSYYEENPNSVVLKKVEEKSNKV